MLGLVAITLPLRADDGAKLFAAKCARCHGTEGEGTKKHPQLLTGDRSVQQLAEQIQKTMPEDDPGTLTAAQAKAIAEDIHGRFYSGIARARNKPARIELARLTVRQYRQAVADAVGTTRPMPTISDVRGLKGEYFAARSFNGNKRVLDRVDSRIDFDFGEEPAVKEKMEPHEFSIRWTGSLLAPETGEYEFTVHTEHAISFWLNDNQKPLIDAWVKSGKEVDYIGRIFLVAGRLYPLRLEYAKAKQGVDDKIKKAKIVPEKSSIRLLWKRPGQVKETVSNLHLIPAGVPESYACGTKFPPDDRSVGWERGTAISKEWDAATTEAALDAAAYVNLRLGMLAGSKDDPKKLIAFALAFAERAFRRPLTEGQKAILIEKQFHDAKDPASAVQRVVLLTLKSPFFLYREVKGGSDTYDTAARLSFGLWDAIPDEILLKAAANGQLNTQEQVAKQAERMLNDPRAKVKLREFLLTWLRADEGRDLAKNAERYPDFDTATIADLRTSLVLQLDDALASPKADFRELLLSNEMFVNDRLAKFYDVASPKGAEFEKTAFDSGQRAGVLTHPYLMASFASDRESSPILRGVFLARGVLGVSLRPPPEAVAPLAPELHPNLTTRERVAMQTQATACMTCHGIINPLGFALEHFDAVGKYRKKDHDKAIDARGSFQGRDGKSTRVNGARELGEFLAKSPEAHEAFVEQMFHHLVQQPVRAYGPNVMVELRNNFAKNEFNIRKLAVDVMTSTALQGRADEGGKR